MASDFSVPTKPVPRDLPLGLALFRSAQTLAHFCREAMLQYPLGNSLTGDSRSPNNRDSKVQAVQHVKNTGTPGEDRSMKQFKVTFTRILTHEEVIEAGSLEAARKRADERERELVISDFNTETTSYDIQEANGDNQNN